MNSFASYSSKHFLLQLLQELHILLAAQIQLRKQIGSPLSRSPDRLFSAPLRDLGVVARKEYIGDAPVAKIGGARVMGIFQQAAAVRLFQGRFFAVQHPRYEAAGSIH